MHDSLDGDDSLIERRLNLLAQFLPFMQSIEVVFDAR
jgi:hypothetical protein